MKTTKLTALLLAALMLLTALTSCGSNGENTSDTAGTNETAAEGETKNAYDSLAKTDWKGETFTVLTRDDVKGNFFVEAYGAEGNTLLDDCIYQRNRIVEKDLNVRLEVLPGGDYTAVNSTVISQATAGTDDYDMIIGHKFTFTQCAVNNYLYDMAEIDTLDLSNPWWEASARDNLTVNGHTALMSGDILPASLTISSCLCFNKRLMKEMNKTEPYDAVKAGKWTMDMLNELTADVTQDISGDGKIRIQDDLYGMTSWWLNSPFGLYYASGSLFVTITEDGLPELDYDQEKMVDIYAKIYQCLITQNSNFCTEMAEYGECFKMFRQGRALFMDCSLNSLSTNSAEMEDDYGVLPQPKYDEMQKEYYAFVNGAAPFVGIIVTEKNPEFVGAVIEALGACNYVNVTPNMFEIVTKYRSTRDPQSAEMVDFIIRNRIFDFGYFFDLEIGNVVRDQLKARKAEISAKVKQADKSSQNGIKKILKAYEKNA